MTDRKKPGVAFWATVLFVGLPILYVASLGPACWLADRELIAWRPVWHAYYPLGSIATRSPRTVLNAYVLWGTLASPYEVQRKTRRIALRGMPLALEIYGDAKAGVRDTR